MSDRYPEYPAGTMSVTEVIRAVGFMPEYRPQDAEWYMERGTAIHQATEFYDKGTLNPDTVDPHISGYLESWKLLGKKYASGHIEIKAYDSVYLYCGCIDRIDGDLKSGAPAKWHRIQAGAYWGLKKLAGLGADPMSTWYLQADGSMPKVVTYTIKELREALEIFKCALVVARTRKEMNP